MRAAIYSSYGPPEVLEIKDIENPSIKDEDRVLIKVHNASVNAYDYLFRKGYLPTRLENGLTKPKNHILGIDVAGTIEAVAKTCTDLRLAIQFSGVVWDPMQNMSPLVRMS
jgi:NADPH:quinone reductase-like Zn-dependent oxidoreductase